VRPAIVACLALLAVSVPPARAQSQPEFVNAFSGNWQVYEQRLSTTSAGCRLELSGLARGTRLSLATSDCVPPLSSASSWSIEGSQLVLYDAQDRPLVKLGGNQRRVTGTTTTDLPLVLERAGGDGTSTKLQALYNAGGCYYLGYTQTCAPRSELAEPAPAPDGRIQIGLLANLGVHSEPRGDSDLVGTAQRGSCIVVDACTMASDGPWCRAKFSSTTGWLRKLTVRQNRWAIVAFSNSCS
jgi:hypothetical protein